MPYRNADYLHVSTGTIIRFFAILLGIAALFVVRDIVFSLIFAVIVASAVEPAIECYTKAAETNPQSAAAFLRLAIMYGRRQDITSASAAFDKSETLYNAMSNPEGLSEVLSQRAALLITGRKLGEARPLLEKSIEISRTTNNAAIPKRIAKNRMMVPVETCK